MSGTCSSVKVLGWAWGSTPATSPVYGGPLFAEKLPRAAPTACTHCLPPAGVKIIFRVGLVLLKQALGSPEKVRGCQGQYETIERLRSLSPKVMQEAFLVQEVRPPLPLTPGGRGRLRALVGACGLVLSSPGRCGETSSFCLNKERGTERPRST